MKPMGIQTPVETKLLDHEGAWSADLHAIELAYRLKRPFTDIGDENTPIRIQRRRIEGSEPHSKVSDQNLHILSFCK